MEADDNAESPREQNNASSSGGFIGFGDHFSSTEVYQRNPLNTHWPHGLSPFIQQYSTSSGYHANNIAPPCTNGPGPFLQPYSTITGFPHNAMGWGYQLIPYSGQYFGNGVGPLHNFPTTYAGFNANNINQTCPYVLGEPSQYAGSFSNLLMRASTGAMHLDIGGRNPHEYLDFRGNTQEQPVLVDKPDSQHEYQENWVHTDHDDIELDDTELDDCTQLDDTELDDTELDDCTQLDDAEVDDEGYLGGQECEEENNDAGSTEVDDDPITEVVDFEETNMDVEMIYDTGSETDIDGDQEGPKSVHLGDCGCITGDDVDCVAHGIEDLSSDSGDSDASDKEEENDIDVDLSQEIYIDKAQEGVPYRKRKRVPKGQKRPNCRTPRAIGAAERAMRTASKRKPGTNVFEPVLGMVFDSREEAKEFYNMYSWEVGFGVRFNINRPSGKKVPDDDEERYISMQDIVCQRQGYDSRITDSTKRCGCPAKIRLLRTDDYGWYISSIVSDHNHELSQTPAAKREWNSHKGIEPSMKRMIKNLRQCNVSITKVHCIMDNMFGDGTGDVSWTRRSLRTICQQISKDQVGDDMRKTMEIFRDMFENDPGFQFSVDVDKMGRVKTLLWCSGRARDQYACFGDVVTFDTTYCTNIYKMPFGLFVGVNHHFQTTIFGGVLMRRETASSFKWVFKEFLHLMGGKAPQTILTDQCKAMAKAIRLVMPNTYHLWCKWHVMKKIRECLGPLYTKNKKFRDEFWLVVNGMLTIDEFEGAWAELIKKYKLEKNAFMLRIYNSRKKWGKPWSKDKFCARMSSTQRSESANFMLKRYVPRNSSMNHFVSQYSRMLQERDKEEDIAEDKTKQVRMIHSRLWPFERHALKIYTKASFELFRSEVDKASNYEVSDPEGNIYIVSHDNAEKRKQWARVEFKVEVVGAGERYICECGLYEHFGIMCCHSIRIMMQLKKKEIPSAHIMKRWTRDARDVLPAQLKRYQKDQTVRHCKTYRDRLMDLQSVKLKDRGEKDLELFEIVMKHMRAGEKEADELLAKRKKDAESGQVEDSDEEERQDDQVGVQSDGGVLRNQKYNRRNVGSLQKQKTADGDECVLLKNNNYGASGSSAGFSDSEILGLKAPFFKRPAWQPRNNRFYAGYEKKKKQWKNKNNKNKDMSEEMLAESEKLEENGKNTGMVVGSNKNKGSKRIITCGNCKLKGHNATQCYNLPVTDANAARHFES